MREIKGMNQVHYADIGTIDGEEGLPLWEVQKVLKDGKIAVAPYKYTLDRYKLQREKATKIIDREDLYVTSSYHDSANGDI